MILRSMLPATLTLAIALLVTVALPAQEETPAILTDVTNEPEAPVSTLLEKLGKDVQTYNEHVVTLSSPFMEGRVPGSRGMEVAKDYMEFWLKDAGLEPAFPAKEGGKSFRQPFPLGGTRTVTNQKLIGPGGVFASGTEFIATGLGTSGEFTGPVTFVGYGIRRGPRGHREYSSFAEDTDLSGKIALVLRFEPMDATGKSLWAEGDAPWTGSAAFAPKLREIAKRGAKAIIIINTPGAKDPRAQKLTPVGESGSANVEVPVMMISAEAGAQLVQSLGTGGKSLLDLRRDADAGGKPVELGGEVTVAAEIEKKSLIAENVGGLLPGRGALKDEMVIIGAHLDHLGMGNFGSRSGPGKLHPGADDNASGSAAVMMIADRVVKRYAELPADAPARSILFVGFSAEESGLNGSAYYVKNPLVPLEKHALMINFDMIGRIKNKRLSVSGVASAEGMEEWLKPLFDKSPLTIKTRAGAGGGSDHLPFYQKKIPVLFGIIADFHGDYHTPEDLSWKINRVDAVNAVYLFSDILYTAGTRDVPFTWTQPGRRSRVER